MSELEDLIKQIEKQEKEFKDFETKNNDEMFFSKTFELYEMYLRLTKDYESEKELIDGNHNKLFSNAEKFIQETIKKYYPYRRKWVIFVDGKIDFFSENLIDVINEEEVQKEKSKRTCIVYIPEFNLPKNYSANNVKKN